MRRGRSGTPRKWSPEERRVDPVDEALARILDRFYADRRHPDKVLLPFPRPRSGAAWPGFHGERDGRKVIGPQAGRQRKLVEMAVRNAERLLGKPAAENRGLVDLARILGLEEPPAGSRALISPIPAATSRWLRSLSSITGNPAKDEYRKYKIKSVAGPNDVASLAGSDRSALRPAPRERDGAFPTLSSSTAERGSSHAAERGSRSWGSAGCRSSPWPKGRRSSSRRKQGRIAAGPDLSRPEARPAYPRRSPPLRHNLSPGAAQKKSFILNR